jgi:hypothetical protein
MRGPIALAAVVWGWTLCSGGIAAAQATKRITYADGRLWLLSPSAGLSSLIPGARDAVQERAPEGIFDMCARQGHPLIVTCHGERCGSFAIWRRSEGTWSIESTVKTNGDNVVAMVCSEEATTLLTNRRAIQIRQGKARSGGHDWKPSKRWPEPIVTAAHAQGDAVFVGLDAGEWGGGLLRIDMTTGRTTMLGGKKSDEICGALLDPVNAIAAAPWNTGCVVAAVGLSHFHTRGRLIEICGTKLRPIGGSAEPSRADASKAVDSEAFYGLVRSGNVLWAAGRQTLYRVDENSTKPVPLPALRPVAGIGVSFEVPGLVVLVKNAHSGMAVGAGEVPDLLAR